MMSLVKYARAASEVITPLSLCASSQPFATEACSRPLSVRSRVRSPTVHAFAKGVFDFSTVPASTAAASGSRGAALACLIITTFVMPELASNWPSSAGLPLWPAPGAAVGTTAFFLEKAPPMEAPSASWIGGKRSTRNDEKPEVSWTLCVFAPADRWHPPQTSGAVPPVAVAW
eukprot:scaffold90735_cov72-Phaeocystis_antarctica.AAC.6